MQIYCKKCKKHTGNTFPKKVGPDFKEYNQGQIKMSLFLLTDAIKENGDLLCKM